MKKNRGRPATKQETGEIIESFLQGDGYVNIAKRLYRSIPFVKAVIEKVGVPEKLSAEERQKIEYLPEECVSQDFEVGETAWSAKYHTSCEIIGLLDEEKYGSKYGKCYSIYVREASESGFGGFYGAAPAYDLGKLNHLQEFGVNVKSL